MDKKTLILSARDVRSILSMKDAVHAVELAFADHARGAAMMPPKVYLSLEAYAAISARCLRTSARTPRPISPRRPA